MPIPDYQSLMLPVLQISSKGEIRIGQAVEELANQLGLTLDERSELLPSGKQTLFSNRVHWAKTYLNKAGLIEITRRGHFKITPRGQEVLNSNPSCINNEFLAQYEEFNQFRDKTNKPENEGNSNVSILEDEKQTPDEIMREAHRKIEASLAQDLLDRIRNSPPDFFERLIINLLLSMGYGGSAAEAGRALGRSGDNGVDGVIDQDALGLDRVYIQAKRYAAGNSVQAGDIRDFFGSLNLHKATKGLFVTTSSFSSPAMKTAESLSNRIVLIDGDQLAKLMIRYNVGCRIEDTIHIRKIDEEFFDL
ncbi:MAG: restriction endonuclease [Methylobacter sp.]